MFDKVGIDEPPMPAKACGGNPASVSHAAKNLGVQTEESSSIVEVHYAHVNLLQM
ncbi:MAG: hypothetical protein HYX62_06550 [Gammaproteobacteria bacterium]|nr:hypothetical protein [Gammaproteobacteria bacterium]